MRVQSFTHMADEYPAGARTMVNRWAYHQHNQHQSYPRYTAAWSDCFVRHHMKESIHEFTW